jgi:conflict system pore-forming effector with SLATT domain
MFDVSLVDHIRLTFGHIAYRHDAHTRMARSRARWGRRVKALSTLAITAALVTAVATIVDYGGRGRAFTIATAALAAVALIAVLADLLCAFEQSGHAHGVCAGRLWHLRERYRALLSDLSDGAIDSNGARTRRDALIDDLREIYESAPTVGWHAIESPAGIEDGKLPEGREKTAAA